MHFFEKSGSIKWRTLQFPRRRDRVDGDDASVGASYLYFRINRADAESIIDNFKEVVSQWSTLAGALGLSKREQDNMAPAFRLAEPMQ
ncbi:hypothetical protein [Pseudomonas sp. PP3]|uniref:hypothetical protein n=1 Tax=Pseudomonas sp. PP3 TaxID=2815936 RepID=UPI001FD4EC55|nr:hypothetical protein [Pseudomonas sp. PP3]